VRGWLRIECRGGETTLVRDPALPAFNYDTLEGATYLVDPAAPVGRRIHGLRVAGKEVQPDETFTVAINSYRAAGGGGYPHLATAPRVREIDRPMVELIVEYFVRHTKVTPAADDNWSFTLPLREAQAPRASAGAH
jgi:2',3'-cyclic-nucleotide 2'-phosphodiesterase (5'-nucleotidase family)